MRYTWIDEGSGNGPVTGINRNKVPGEIQSDAPTTEFVWGYEPRFYSVKNFALKPKDQEDVEDIQLEDSRSGALTRLWAYHDELIEFNTGATATEKTTRLTKSLRKEADGNANAGDIERLDTNDTLDSWYDDIERDAEDQGEAYIEDPARTKEELDSFDPETDVTWTPYPL